MAPLHKSTEKECLAGVCSGIAETFDIDITIVRLISIILLFAYGSSFWIYIILAFIMPDGDEVGRYDKNGNWYPKNKKKKAKKDIDINN